MSDLISRSKVIDVLKETGIIQDNDLGHLVVDEICRIQTAYDIDKVVEELHKIEEHCLEMNDWQGQSAVVDAIEIVKRGGVADDVCKKLVWYRFKTKSVKDFHPIINMKDIQMPWWCTGIASDESYANIICYLPKGEDLYKYWDDAYDIESDERTGITYTDRFPRPNWIKPEDGDSVDCSCMYIDRSRV